MAVTTTKFMQYSVLPGIWPRIKALFGSGLSFLAGTLAVVYFNLGLLPANHPYLDKDNLNRFGVRHVVAAAGKNLVFSWKNIDKIILYFTILIGLTILVLQLVIIISSVTLYAPAFAAGGFLDTFSGGSIGFGGTVRDMVIDFFNGAGVGTTGWIVFSETAAGPRQDIAFVVLDQVFGVMQRSGTGFGMGFFESCISDQLANTCTDIKGEILPDPAAFPTNMHLAMHQMLGFYTMGIAFLSLVVILYYVTTIVGETVTTGTPFGQRFNKAWFIPRLIMFFALLAPITLVGNNRGINVAQLITFSVAKFGSNFATNAWLVFLEGGVDQASNSPADLFGKGQTMVGLSRMPDAGSLVQYLYIVRMCMYAEKLVHGRDIIPYVVRPHSEDPTPIREALSSGGMVPYNAIGGTTEDYLPYYEPSSQDTIPFYRAVEFSRYRNVVLRFGHKNPPGGVAGDPNDPPDAYSEEWGYVEPTCGELQFEVTSLDPFVTGDSSEYGIQEVYWWAIDNFMGGDISFREVTHCMLQSIIPIGHDPTCIDNPISTPAGMAPGQIEYDPNGWGPFTTTLPVAAADNENQWLTLEVARANIEAINAIVRMSLRAEQVQWDAINDFPAVDSVRDEMLDAVDSATYVSTLMIPDELKERGWAGAALWYNSLAQLNGLYTSAIQNVPRPFKYPLVMERVAYQHQIDDENSMYTQRFNPRLANGKIASLPRPGDQYIAAALYSMFEFWNSSAVQETVFTRKSNNPIIDTINMILGTSGIYDIVENRGVYPLAMLSGLGKSMVDAALRNLWVGVIGQGVGEIMDGFLGGLAKVGSTFAFRFGMIGLGIGFILYYVLPVLPFIYFFFAFGGWVKSIFEAVLAMPLWALAHINIEGEGLPGPWASNGYFLLFEIFLRPILIIGGFVFSISVYTALINALHDSYHVVVMVASGYDMLGEINDLNSAGNFANLTASDPIEYMRGPVDEMFYSVVYVIMVYMIGLSCFKLVDTIPNNIMRWMGVTVSSFQEQAGDPAGQMTSKLFRATQVTNIQLTGLINKAQGFSNAGNDAQTAMLATM